MIRAFLLSAGLAAAELPTCQVYSENKCEGNAIVTDPSFEDHRWFTPARGEPGYVSSFQDYSVLAAHVHLVYDSSRTVATAEVLADHRDKLNMTYTFNGITQQSNKISFSKSANSAPVTVTVSGADGSKITLDPIDFMWNAPEVHPVEESAGDYRNGQKGAIVEFFMWPHEEVEKECAMLAQMGYMGAKLFPAQEQIMSQETFSGDLNPWYFAYQPVSYRLQGRMGSRDQLRKAINTCRSLGVRMYADAVVNHMTGGGNDANPNHRNPGANCATWGIKNSSLVTSGGAEGPSPMYTQSYVYTESPYTGKPPSQEFPVQLSQKYFSV